MTGTIGKRLAMLEAKAPGASGVWHHVMWDAGQSWTEALAGHPAVIGESDSIIVVEIVDAHNGAKVADSAHDDSRCDYEAWVKSRH